MQRVNLEKLPKETLVELARMYAQNWQTLDGLWFRSIEAAYGLDVATKIDLSNWERQSTIEAHRIRKVLKINTGGLSSVLTALSFMTWQVSSPTFECDEESPERIVFYYPHCSVQEGRRKHGKQEFPCKAMKLTLLSNLAKAIEPRAIVNCLACPPDPHPQDFWCKWELTMRRD